MSNLAFNPAAYPKGLDKELVQRYIKLGVPSYTIDGLLRCCGHYAIEHGYMSITCQGDSGVDIPGALCIRHVKELKVFSSDWDACRQAEKDGVRFINDMDGLEKGCYIDTERNRNICKTALENNPSFRIEAWLDPEDGEWGTRYHQYFFGEPENPVAPAAPEPDNAEMKSMYEKYKLQWMLSHGYTLADLISGMQGQLLDIDPESTLLLNMLFDQWQNGRGFNGEIWPSFEDFGEQPGEIAQCAASRT